MGVTALVQTLTRLDQVEVWMREVGASWIDLKLRMGWGLMGKQVQAQVSSLFPSIWKL